MKALREKRFALHMCCGTTIGCLFRSRRCLGRSGRQDVASWEFAKREPGSAELQGEFEGPVFAAVFGEVRAIVPASFVFAMHHAPCDPRGRRVQARARPPGEKDMGTWCRKVHVGYRDMGGILRVDVEVIAGTFPMFSGFPLGSRASPWCSVFFSPLSLPHACSDRPSPTVLGPSYPARGSHIFPSSLGGKGLGSSLLLTSLCL